MQVNLAYPLGNTSFAVYNAFVAHEAVKLNKV